MISADTERKKTLNNLGKNMQIENNKHTQGAGKSLMTAVAETLLICFIKMSQIVIKTKINETRSGYWFGVLSELA